MSTRVLTASLKDRVPIYALMGAANGTLVNHASLGKLTPYCEACSVLRNAECDQEARCYVSIERPKRVRVSNPVHCATCKCEAEYQTVLKRSLVLKAGHMERYGIPWPLMREFLRTFGTQFCEYWTTGSTAGNRKYPRYAAHSYLKGDKAPKWNRVRTTRKDRCAYAFPTQRAAVPFIARMARRFVYGPRPQGTPVTRPYGMPKRVLAVQLELAFWSWARLSRTRFVGRYRSC